ncbi:MAG: dipicolinate synthase subunit B [Clostridia bacterium]|nr:dipicolinate synthase subunit B [Clostridia bacterium]
MIGYGICASFCTHRNSLEVLRHLTEKFNVVPFVSPNVMETDTRFGKAEDFIKEVREICGNDVISTIKDAEPFGPAKPLECMVISPCTGNTLAKLACGITDTAVTMASKAHLRSGGRLVIALATNDAMSSNLQNIATLLNKKNVFFVPMKQDDPVMKPSSLVADFSLVEKSIEYALDSLQMRPLFL